MHWKNSTVHNALSVYGKASTMTLFDISLSSAFYWNLGYFSGLNALTEVSALSAIFWTLFRTGTLFRIQWLWRMCWPLLILSWTLHWDTPGTYKTISAIFKQTRRKPGPSPDPARLVSNSGTKTAPLLEPGKRGRFSYSTVLSLLSKVYNSIYSKLLLEKLKFAKMQWIDKVKTLLCDTLQKYFLPFIVRKVVLQSSQNNIFFQKSNIGIGIHNSWCWYQPVEKVAKSYHEKALSAVILKSA
jgi:hypothetical protein